MKMIDGFSVLSKRKCCGHNNEIIQAGIYATNKAHNMINILLTDSRYRETVKTSTRLKDLCCAGFLKHFCFRRRMK